MIELDSMMVSSITISSMVSSNATLYVYVEYKEVSGKVTNMHLRRTHMHHHDIYIHMHTMRMCMCMCMCTMCMLCACKLCDACMCMCMCMMYVHVVRMQVV